MYTLADIGVMPYFVIMSHFEVFITSDIIGAIICGGKGFLLIVCGVMEERLFLFFLLILWFAWLVLIVYLYFVYEPKEVRDPHRPRHHLPVPMQPGAKLSEDFDIENW